jgi:hypothetical protein
MGISLATNTVYIRFFQIRTRRLGKWISCFMAMSAFNQPTRLAPLSAFCLFTCHLLLFVSNVFLLFQILPTCTE